MQQIQASFLNKTESSKKIVQFVAIDKKGKELSILNLISTKAQKETFNYVFDLNLFNSEYDIFEIEIEKIKSLNFKIRPYRVNNEIVNLDNYNNLKILQDFIKLSEETHGTCKLEIRI